MEGARHDPRRYIKLAAIIREQVTDGTLVPGMPIPSIRLLCQEYEYSRGTVAKGLRILEQEGILCRVRGLGYYVSSQSLTPLVVPPRRPAD
jgi:GntR family transcriptional regulator